MAQRLNYGWPTTGPVRYCYLGKAPQAPTIAGGPRTVQWAAIGRKFLKENLMNSVRVLPNHV